MPNITYPKSGFQSLSGGLDLNNDASIVAKEQCQELLNLQYEKATLRRRSALTSVNTNVIGDVATDLIEYIDNTGTARILASTYNGKIQEIPTSGAIVDRVTGLTSSKRGNFAQLYQAVFHQNGADLPRRGDNTTWRVAGVPVATTATLGAIGAGAITGTYNYIVTACVRDATLGAVILESDWSNILTTATLTSNNQIVNWSASGDARVNWYRLYRTKNGQGTPYYLVTEGNVLTYTDNTTDLNLSKQLSNSIAVNGVMPKSKYLTVCGQRLVCGCLLATSTNPIEESAIHMSKVSVNAFDMEAFPNDGYHKFYLPGNGAVTCIAPYSVKDEMENAKDLFCSQANSCFLLRRCEAGGILETISTEIGCIGQKAIVQWGRYLFFISGSQGLIFYHPQFGLLPISNDVNPIFFGGGSQNLANYNNGDFYKLAIVNNKLLITYSSKSSATHNDSILVLDLQRFDPNSPTSTAYFTRWNATGADLALCVRSVNFGVLLVDNANKLVLKQDNGLTQDKINNADTPIITRIKTGGIMNDFTMWKKLIRLRVLQVSDADTKVNVFTDYGTKDVSDLNLKANNALITWDSPWDVIWGSAFSYVSTIALNEYCSGYLIQFEFVSDQSSNGYGFSGFGFDFTNNLRRNNTGVL